MRSLKIVLVSLLLSLSIVSIAREADAQTSLAATTGVRTQYVSGFGAMLHDQPVSQTDLFLTLPQKFWVNAWGSTDLSGGKNFGRELNFGAGKTWDNLDVGMHYFDLTPQFATTDGDVVHAHAEAGVDLRSSADHVLRPSIRGEYFYVTQEPGENSGYLGKLTLTETYALFPWLTVSQSPTLLRAQHIFGNRSATKLDYTLKITWNPSDFSLTASGRCIAPLHEVDDASPHCIAGLDATYVWPIAEKK